MLSAALEEEEEEEVNLVTLVASELVSKVAVRMLDLRLMVMGSNPGHDTAVYSFWGILLTILGM